jgi:hypothetical protein
VVVVGANVARAYDTPRQAAVRSLWKSALSRGVQGKRGVRFA